MQTPQDILKKYWGYTSFRPSQEEVITRVLEGKDTLALLPTGGGKSICYQIPALIQKGICIVISPLVALIEDQVQQLKKKDIRVIGLMGSYHKEDLQRLLENCLYGKYKFLYLSPERLQQKNVMRVISQMNVNLIAIDEAHCISQWGHDFRISYRGLSSLRKALPTTPTLALTATATHRVANDIIENLKMSNSIIIRESFERKNIAYSIYQNVNKMHLLKSLILEQQESIIVYVYSRREALEISRKINTWDVKAIHFHGGLSLEEKSKNSALWMNNKAQVIVSTSAFGMGIDKPDVRLIVHWTIPDSIENYYQETGRCGRDGKPSKAVLINTPEDLSLIKERFLGNLPNTKSIKQLYSNLNSYFHIAYGESLKDTLDFNFSEFCDIYNLEKIKTHIALKQLDVMGILTFSEKVKKSDNVQFLVSGNALRSYMRHQQKIIENVIQSILRTYSGVYSTAIEIDLKRLASKAGIKKEIYRKTLQNLDKEKIIKYTALQSDCKIHFLRPREDNYTINPILGHLSSHRSNKKTQLTHMIKYATEHTQCKVITLLHYFGEKKTIHCGVCSACKKISSPKKNKFYQNSILNILKSGSLSVEELAQITEIDIQDILKNIRTLIDEDKVHVEKDKVYLQEGSQRLK